MYGSYGEINVDAGAALNVSGSTITATGGIGISQGGGAGRIYLYSNDSEIGGISINSSQVLAAGGEGASEYPDGRAAIFVSSYSGVNITGYSVLTASGHHAFVDIDANYSAVTLANSSINATAKPSADGGEGTVNINAGGSINAGSSSISATGNPDYPYGGNAVYLSGDSDVTLGSVTATRYVSVNSSAGAIVDGNDGLNILAPWAELYGDKGVGSITNPLETAVTELRVVSYNGDIGVINSGDLWLYGYNAVYAPYGDAAIRATG
jgi:hypothetical protein